MTKSSFERRAEAQKKRLLRQEKLLKVLSAAVSRLGEVLDKAEIPERELRECVYAQNQLHKIVARVKRVGWPEISVSEFMDMRSLDYIGQVETFQGMKIKALRRFLQSQLPLIHLGFKDKKVRLPVVFDILHEEFNRKEAPPLARENVPLFKQQTWISAFYPG